MSPLPSRRLRAVLFVDIVNSTGVAAFLGDERWRELLRRERAILRRQLKRFGGHEVDTAGDGMFAVFPQPDGAVRCGWASLGAVRELGVELRAGVHFGECQLDGDLVQGIVVHTGARLMGLAGPGEVLVSGTVKDLTAGATFGFEDRGHEVLKGVPGSWPVFSLVTVDGEERRPDLGADEAAHRMEGIVPERGRRRRALIVGIALGFVAVAAALALTRGSSAPPASSSSEPALPLEAIIRIDAEARTWTTTLSALPRLGSEQGGLVVGEGAVWAFDSVVRHIDPVTGEEETAGISLNVSSNQDAHPIAVGLQRVWTVTRYGITQIDPADDEVLRETPSHLKAGDPNTQPIAITTGAGAVWVVWSDGSLIRLDDGGRVVAQIDVGELPGGLTVAKGSVWVTDEFEGNVVRIDPKTNEVVDRISIGGSPHSIEVFDGSLWVADRNEGVLVEVDLHTGERIAQFQVGPNPIDLDAGFGFLWVADQGDGTLRQLDHGGQELHSYEFGIELSAVAVDDALGTVWVRTAGRIEHAF